MSRSTDLNLDEGKESAKLFKCHFEGCSRVFRKSNRLETHARVHTGERPYVCGVEGCSKSYARSQHLTRHMKNAHTLKARSSDFSCPVCKRELADKYSLQKHIDSVHKEVFGPKRYECPEPGCRETFHKKKQLINHRLKEHTEHITEAKKCHICPYEGCGKVFTWQNRLQRHLKVHQGYPCKVEGCKEVFQNWSSLRKHTAKDHVKDFICEECGIKFSRKPNLVQHMKRKHQERSQTFTCPWEGCNRVYSYSSNLNLHIRENHMGEEIWRNREKKKAQSSGQQVKRKRPKKKSFAARLCGIDDRGEVLKISKERKINKDNRLFENLEIRHSSEIADVRDRVDEVATRAEEGGDIWDASDKGSSDTVLEGGQMEHMDSEVQECSVEKRLIPQNNLEAQETLLKACNFQSRLGSSINNNVVAEINVDPNLPELVVIIRDEERIERQVVTIKPTIEDKNNGAVT